MKKIIALVLAFAMAITLAVVGLASPASARTCQQYQTKWYSQSTSYYGYNYTPTTLGASLRYRKCSDGTYKALAIGGAYNLGIDYVDCSDNFGIDFTGVTFDFDNRGDDIIGGVDPAPKKMACWPGGRPGPQWWDISGNTTEVSAANVYYAFRVTMSINRSGAFDPSFVQFGWPTPTI